MEAKIYQLTDEAFERVNYAFRGWDKAKDKIDFEHDYECVYTKDFGDVSWCTKDMILDDIFYIFNQQRPEDFTGHSLSVSDIVCLDNDTFYYCDNFGWELIKEA